MQGADKALFEACRKSGQLTIETVISTASLQQSGPARIVTFSLDAGNRNFTLGQDGDKLILRVRTPQTGLNGSKPQLTLTTLPLNRAVHLAVTYQSGKTTCYLEGKQVMTTNKVRGDFSNWEPYKLLFGDEAAGDRDWQGMLDGVSLYARVLTEAEVRRHAAAYRKARGPLKTVVAVKPPAKGAHPVNPISPAAPPDFKAFKTGKMWAPYLEWGLRNASYSGNPFDLIATATFTHSASGEKHTTQMFYDGGTTWKFRFTGTRKGAWTFTTSSSDTDLDGKRGRVTINSNPDSKIKGFLTNYGNKYAVQTGDDGALEAYRFNVYMNGADYSKSFLGDFNSAAASDVYFADARKNGFEIIFIHVNNSWFKHGAEKYNEHKSTDPDPVSFSILEGIITRAHAKGGRVHIWAWGDQARHWTPVGVGGINGAPDKRLQRYVAARLGPVPGWSMGYGFDLHEWTKTSQTKEWASYLHQHFGWQHLLCARGQNDSNFDLNSYDGFGRNVPLKSTSHGPKDYDEIVEDLDGDKNRPHIYEERHSYLRGGFNLTMDGTRRLVWWETMAGGMGGWFGYYHPSVSAYKKHPYPNPEQLRTARDFWKGRFLLSMTRDNGITNGYCLRDSEKKHYVFYGEDVNSIRMNLSAMNGSQPAVAVDCKKAYAEINLGTLATKDKIWNAPYSSDWAIAVGDFSSTSSPPIRKVPR